MTLREPVEEKIKILHHHADYCVVAKPERLSVHPTQDKNEITLLQILQKKLKTADLHLVNRLDKETSGLVVVTFSPAKVQMLNQAIVQKKYHAIVRGGLTVSNQMQEWNWSLSDRAEGQRNPQGKLEERKSCQTHYLVLRSNKFFSEIECELLTGRQHQIRKHALLAKHPIVGDRRYNDRSYNEKMSQLYGTDRMFLHASSLTLNYKEKVQQFHSELPLEFEHLMERKDEQRT